MIAKATVHDNGGRLARYLITGKDGETAELCELSGFASTDIVEAFRSVHVMAAGTQCDHPFFHIQIRNPESDVLTREQWLIVADRIERMLGLSGQPRAIALHTDRRTGGEHMHLAFSRIDHETLTARKLPFFKRRLITLSRELEAELGLTRVRADRASVIKYAPLRPQQEQARRLGVDIRNVLEAIRECFDRSDCGRSFELALAHHRFTLARGERRDFAVLDHAGGIHSLGKRLLGVSAAQIRTRLSDLPKDSLPTVEQVRQRLSAAQGGGEKQDVDSEKRANHKQQRRPVPAIRISAPSIRRRQTTEYEQDWTAPAISPVPTAIQPERVPPEWLSFLVSKTAPDVPCCGLEEAPIEPPTPKPVILTEISLASDRPEDDKREQSRRHKSAPLADVLKKQFRALVRALVRGEPSPQSQARRRRGEAVGSFRSAARNLLRPILRFPGISQTIGFLNDAVPWIHLWDWSEAAEHVSEDEPGSTTGDHLSPHP